MDKQADLPHPAREPSLGLILRLVSEGEIVTRTDLVRRSGLSKSAVADLVGRLLRSGDLVVDSTPAHGRGRPSQLLRLPAPDGVVLAFDFGHQHLRVAVALADASGADAVLGEEVLPASLDEDGDAVFAVAETLARTMLAAVDRQISDVASAVAGVPGPLHADGTVQLPSLFGTARIPSPARELSSRLGLRVRTTHDTNLGAIGEMQQGAAQAARDFIYVKASHGLGATIVIDREIYHGSSRLAGEIGHTVVPGAKGRCRCGNSGCLETAAAVSSVLAELPPPYGIADILGLTDPGDPVVTRVVTDAGRTVGVTLAMLSNALNPELFVTGGILGTLPGSPFTQGVRESLDRYAQPATARAVTVSPAAHGTRAEIVGALTLARRQASRGIPRVARSLGDLVG